MFVDGLVVMIKKIIFRIIFKELNIKFVSVPIIYIVKFIEKIS